MSFKLPDLYRLFLDSYVLRTFGRIFEFLFALLIWNYDMVSRNCVKKSVEVEIKFFNNFRNQNEFKIIQMEIGSLYTFFFVKILLGSAWNLSSEYKYQWCFK